MSGTGIDTVLDNLLHEGRGVLGHAGKIYGVVPAIITAVHDTKGPKRHKLGMVQVYFPWLQDAKDPALINPWARMAMPEAGKGNGDAKDKPAGIYSPHQAGGGDKPGDEVLVAFEQGDPHFPFVLGSMWNGENRIPLPITDKDGCVGSDITKFPKENHGTPDHNFPDLSPQSLGGDTGENKTYFWRSRTGNLVILDDKAGQVRVIDRSGNSKIQAEKGDVRIAQLTSGGIFFHAAKSVIIDCENFELHAKANIKMHAGNDWTVTANKAATEEAKGKYEAKAGTSIAFEAKGEKIGIATEASMNVKSGSTMSLKANSGNAQIKGDGGVMVTSAMDATFGSKAKVGLDASMISISSLMAVNVIAGGKFTAKGAVIMLN